MNNWKSYWHYYTEKVTERFFLWSVQMVVFKQTVKQ